MDREIRQPSLRPTTFGREEATSTIIPRAQTLDDPAHREKPRSISTRCGDDENAAAAGTPEKRRIGQPATAWVQIVAHAAIRRQLSEKMSCRLAAMDACRRPRCPPPPANAGEEDQQGRTAGAWAGPRCSPCFAAAGEDWTWPPPDRKSTRLNSSHSGESRMPSSA